LAIADWRFSIAEYQSSISNRQLPIGKMRRQLQADLALLAVTVIWGSTFVIIKNLLTQVAPFTLLAVRFGLATLVVGAIFATRLVAAPRRELAAGVLVGAFLFAGYAFQTVGLQYTTAAKSGFITGLAVVIVPFAALLVLRQRPGRGAMAGVLLATAGLALLTLRGDLTLAYGDLITLGCAFAFALQIVFVGRFAPRSAAVNLTAAQLVTVAVASAACALIAERPTLHLSAEVWAAAAFLALAGTAFALIVQSVAQRFTSATHTALIFTAEPVFALLFAVLLAGERLGERELLGCALMLAGMLVAELWRR
jgi:drug/metabolite transporter (DMT)-like permease